MLKIEKDINLLKILSQLKVERSLILWIIIINFLLQEGQETEKIF